MDPFATEPLGRSGVRLPRLGFGGAPLGELFTRIPETQAQATLAAAWDAGFRYFDTSPWYGRGQSEHRLGRFLCAQPRDAFLLSTKVGRVLRRPRSTGPFDTGFWAGGLPFDHYFDYRYDGIMRSYEDSLQRLGLTRVDMLVIHDLDRAHHGTDAMVAAHMTQLASSGIRALSDLRAAGEIRAVGVGVNELGTIPLMLEHFEPDFFLLALRYTLGEQTPLEAELPVCEAKGIGIVAGGVFNSGLYATGPTPGARYDYGDASPEQQEKAGRIQAVCERHGVPLAAAALQFPLHYPAVTSVLTGIVEPAQVATNVEHLRRDIPPALWADLKGEGLLHPRAPTGAG